MNKQVYIIYHRKDLDGHMSGAIAKMHFLREGLSDNQIEMIGHDYNDDHETLVHRIPVDDSITVVVLDLSLPPKYMKSLFFNNYLIWIDHHQTDDSEFPNVAGVRQIGVAACQLAWDYFTMDHNMPMLVQMLGLYDVWNHDVLDWNDLLSAQYALKAVDTDPSVSDKLIHLITQNAKDHGESISLMIMEGYNILKFQRKQCEEWSAHAHVEAIGAYNNVLCLNSQLKNSMSLEHLFDPKIHDFMLVYFWDGSKRHWSVSGYHPCPVSFRINLGKYFVQFGGGGHAGAAGFVCKKLPWAK